MVYKLGIVHHQESDLERTKWQYFDQCTSSSLQFHPQSYRHSASISEPSSLPIACSKELATTSKSAITDRVAAETIIDPSRSDNARGDAFRLIAGYIFGANKSREKVAMTSPVEITSQRTKVAMTAPVEVNKSDSALVMRFFMPSKYSIDQLPVPSDPNVKLRLMPPTTVAVLRFSGSTSNAAVSLSTAELVSGLQSSKWKAAGAAIFLQSAVDNAVLAEK